MAIERNMSGFEITNTTEFDLVQAGASIVHDQSLARTGEYFLRSAPVAGPGGVRFAADGIVIGVGASPPSRLKVRFYVRVNSLPASGTPMIASWETRYQVRISSTGQLSIQIVGDGPINGPIISVGSWHEIVLEAYEPTGGPITIEFKMMVDGGTATTASKVVSGSSSIAEFTLGALNETTTYSIDFDDWICFAANSTDGTNPLTLPTATRILPMPVVAQGGINQWSGSYVDVQEVPVSTSPDTYQSSSTNGNAVRWKKGSLSWMANLTNRVEGIKIYVALRHNASGTRSVNVVIDGAVVKTLTNYPLIPAGYSGGAAIRGGFDWTSRDIQTFDVVEYGLTQNGTCEARIGSVLMEILIREVVPIVLTVTPDTGTWKGGTAFSVTGKYFASTTAIKFDGVSADDLRFVDSQNMNGRTPPHLSGAGAVDVTAE